MRSERFPLLEKRVTNVKSEKTKMDPVVLFGSRGENLNSWYVCVHVEDTQQGERGWEEKNTDFLRDSRMDTILVAINTHDFKISFSKQHSPLKVIRAP